jgi:multiple sugar transport system ATP-binding protein
MDTLEVQKLVKHINSDLTIDQVSFEVKNDEFFVLLGPSGSGKSSILRLICGFEWADGGKILINGQDVTNTPPHLRNVAVVFQDYALFPNMSVFENIAYGLHIRRLPRSEIEMRVLMAVETLKIKPLLKHSLSNLSGGELQRVALARVLVKDADVYLFDEPLSQLDPRTRYQARQEIMMVHHIKRKPSIYITHDQDEAFAMASFVAVLSKGRFQQIGTPDELINMPANLFVAHFIGNPPINLLNGMIQLIATHYQLYSDGFNYTLPAYWTSILAHLGPQALVIIGIKPNMIIPEWSLDTSAHIIVSAQISKVEPVMGEVLVTLKIGFGTEILAIFDDTYTGLLVAGQFMNIALDLNRLYLFNPQTGQLLNK